MDVELTRLCDVSQALIAQILSTPTLDRDLVDWERGCLLANNQSFNTLRGAWALVFSGFPAQALALVRLAHEFLILGRFCRENPDQAADVFVRPVKTGSLSREIFADDEVLGEKFRAMRSSLNQFAHQSPAVFGMSMAPDEQGRSALHLGPFIHRSVLREVGYELVACSVLVVGELLRWLGITDPQWSLTAVTFASDAQAWLHTVREPA